MNEFEQRLRLCQTALRDADAGGAPFDMGTYSLCGSPGCVLGHLGARQDLQQDLKWDRLGFITLRGQWSGYSFPNLHAHFGLTVKEAYELFDGSGCGGARTAAEAIKYIESFIARKWPAPIVRLPDWNALASEPLPAGERIASAA